MRAVVYIVAWQTLGELGLAIEGGRGELAARLDAHCGFVYVWRVMGDSYGGSYTCVCHRLGTVKASCPPPKKKKGRKKVKEKKKREKRFAHDDTCK